MVLPPTVPVPVLPEVEARPVVVTVEEGMVVAMEIRQDQEPSRPGGNPISMLGMAFFAASESLTLQCNKQGFGHPSRFTTLTTFPTYTLAPTSHSIAYFHVPRTTYFAHNFSLSTPAWNLPIWGGFHSWIISHKADAWCFSTDTR